MIEDELILKLSELEEYILKNGDVEFDSVPYIHAGNEIVENIITDLCLLYLKANEKQRLDLSELISGKHYLIYSFLFYIGRVSKYLWSTEDENWLYLGLIAAAIEDCGSDYRDTILSLEYLYYGALRAGINPEPYFLKVSQIVKNGIDYRDSVGPILKSFHEIRKKRPRKDVGEALIHKKSPSFEKLLDF